jgi:hypothetical protein
MSVDYRSRPYGAGFHDLDSDGLRAVIRRYENGLAEDCRFPCGMHSGTVVRWLREARAELRAR